MRDVCHTLIVRKHLEGSEVHARLDLHALDSNRRQLIGKDHRVFLRGAAVEVVVGNGCLGVVEAVFGRQKVIDGSPTITHHMVSSQKLGNNF